MRSISVFLLAIVASSPPVHSLTQQAPERADVPLQHLQPRAGWELNHGQLPEGALYASRTGPGTTVLTDQGAVIDLGRSEEDGPGVALGLTWFEGSAPEFVEENLRTTRLNFIHSSDPEEWITAVPTFDIIRQEGVWPGIDVRWHVGHGRLEYDFELAAGADLDDVRILVEGAEELSIGPNGELHVDTLAGRLVHSIPRVWQERGGEPIERHGRFYLVGPNLVGFRVDRHDPSLPLVIDPIVDWGTYLAATGVVDMLFSAVAVDDDGSVAYGGYVRGNRNLVTTPGTYDPVTIGDTTVLRAIIGKVSADGSTLLWATWLGDTATYSSVEMFDLGLLSDGRVAFTARAYFQSNSYPFTANSGFPPTPHTVSGVLTVLSADGSDVAYSASLGGLCLPYGLDIDAQDRIYVAGSSSSSDQTFATPGAYLETRYPTGYVPFATRIDIDAREREYWTWLSGARDARVWKVAADDQGRAFFVGDGVNASTYGPFPTPNGFLATSLLDQDLWVGALNADGSDLDYGTYVDQGSPSFLVHPGSGFSPGASGSPLSDIDTDGTGRIWFGWTGWPGFSPNTGDPMPGSRDMIVTCLDTTRAGTESIVWSRALGVSWMAYGGFARVLGDLVLAAGNTASSLSPCDPQVRGDNDAIVAAFDKETGDLQYSWIIGGEQEERSAHGESPFDVNPMGRAVLGGQTYSATQVATPGALNETYYAGNYGAPFLSTILDVTRDPCGPNDTEPPVVTITAPTADAISGATSTVLSAEVADDGATNVTSTPSGVAPAALPAGGGTVTGNVALLSEGGNLLTVNAIDEAGNEGGSSVTTYRDTVAPVVTVAPAEGNVVGTTSVELLVTVADQTETVVTVEGAPEGTLPVDGGAPYGTVDGSLTSTHSGLLEGANSFTVTAVDAAGNATTVVRGVTVDSQAPVIAINAPQNGEAFSSTPVDLDATVTDDSTVEVTGVLTASLPAGGGPVSGAVPLTEGWNELGLDATDALSNQASASVSVLLDTLPPAVEISSPLDLALVRGVVDYHVLAADPAPGTGVATVELRVDGNPLESFASGPYESMLDTTLLSDGWHSLVAIGTDGLGNAAQDEIQIQVDNTPPTIEILDPTAGALLVGDLTFSAYAADAQSGLASVDMLSGGDAPSITDGSVAYATPVVDDVRTSVDVAPATDGAWTLSANATDAAGNSAATQIEVFTDNSAPAKAILFPADGARISGPVPIQVSVADPNLDRSELYLDGTLVATETALDFTHLWDTTVADDGEVAISLLAFDTLGNSTSCTIRVTVDNSSCVEIHPETLNLKSKGKVHSITVKVCGYGLEELLPTEDADLRLCVPGGSAVPSTADFSGDDHVHDGDGDGFGELLLKFDRQLLISSIRAGIQSGAITGGEVVLTLKAGDHVLGSDEMRLVGE